MTKTPQNLQRVSVITQAGKVVGVYVPPPPPTDSRAPIARLVAGPRQQLHEVMADVPALLKSSKDINAFHAAMRKELKKGKRRR
jgi:hypothetical protein